MALIKTPEEIKKLRAGGKLLSQALQIAVDAVKAGVKISELDQLAEQAILDGGGKPSFKNYQSSPSDIPFPSTVCISVNEEVVHGLGNRDLELKEGDIVSLDIGCWYQGLCTDMSITVPVGKIPKETQELLAVTKESLMAGVKNAQVGGFISDIGRAIEKVGNQAQYGVVRALTGHGVGHAVHEFPSVPNYVDPYQKPIPIKNGMVLALEPMFALGTYQVVTADDGWAVSTADNSLSAHFEVTIACTEQGPEIITPLPIQKK